MSTCPYAVPVGVGELECSVRQESDGVTDCTHFRTVWWRGENGDNVWIPPETCWRWQRERADRMVRSLREAVEREEAAMVRIARAAEALESALGQCETPGCDDWHKCDLCSRIESVQDVLRGEESTSPG